VAATRVLAAVARAEEPPGEDDVRAALRLDALLADRAGTDAEERWSAERRLGAVFVQAAFYRPAGLVATHVDERLTTLLAVAAAIEPGQAGVQYRLAAVLARRGERGRALEHLERAIEAGWRDRARLEADPSFAALHGERRYAEALRRLGE